MVRSDKHAFKMLRWLLLATALLLLAACGGTGGGPAGPSDPDDPDPPSNGTLEEALNELGVNTAATPRVGKNGEPLPASYSPLGASPDLDKVDELFLVGFSFVDDGNVPIGTNLNLIEQNDDGEIVTLHSLQDEDNEWAVETPASRSLPRTMRDVTAADVDGDGFEEIAIVYMDGNEVTLKIIDDQEAGYAESVTRLAAATGVEDVRIASGDFDGDGRAEIVIALAKAESAELLFAKADGAGGFAIEADWTKTYTPSVADAQLALELAAGNLDYDAPDELVVILNEYIDDGSDGDGVARYFIYDDAASGFAELKSGYVESRSGPTRSAVIANVAIGDIDGDGLGEVVIAGLTNYGRCDSYGHLLIALDDAESDFASLGDHHFDHFFHNCPAFDQWMLRYLHVNTLDLSGSGAHEVQVNQFIFQSWQDAAPWTRMTDENGNELTLPQEEIFVSPTRGGWYDRSTSVITTGDVTADGRHNIVSYNQDKGSVSVWGVDQTDPDQRLSKVHNITVQSEVSQNPINPLVVPVNIDADSPILRVDEGSHQLAFTEPIVIAALAAAPCSTGIGQNTGDCKTSFGRGESSTIDESLTVSIRASVHTGLKLTANIPFVPESGVELEQTVSRKASETVGTSYRLEKTVTFTTGALEDAVIFTTVPYDHYVYTVLSHPDPDLVDSTIDVWLPREPITMIVEREFYNAAVMEGELQIGSDIFDHTVGDHHSYPTRSQKSQLLTQHGGLEHGPVSVGQGTGDTSVRVAVEDAITKGESLGIEIEQSIKVTAGPVMAGFSWGVGAEASLSITSGELTEYVGTVGSIDAANFTDNQYSFGLFTYPLTTGGQAFQVLNYWVE